LKKISVLLVLCLSLSIELMAFGSEIAFDQTRLSSVTDADHLQMLVWDKVHEKYQFSGLAQYYNNVDYYLFEKDVLQEIDERVTIELSAKQWFVAVGRFNVLLVQAEGLIVYKSNSLIMTENTEVLSRLSSTVKILSKPELGKLSPAFDILRYHHLWFGFAEIAKLVEAVLVFIQTKFIGNWGLVLFVFAILVKLILLPLSIFTAKLQRRVSEVQSKLAPKLQEIKLNYDGEEAHNLLMAAHKELGVSPFYTLKPLIGPLVQIPILIGIFNALGEMPHFQESPFLWIQNLAYPDSVGSLPISIPMFGLDVSLLPGLMTAVTIVSTVLFTNSKASEEELSKQKRNLYLMAAAFFLLFYPFPAVMVLYWTYSNILHIAQQKVVKI